MMRHNVLRSSLAGSSAGAWALACLPLDCMTLASLHTYLALTRVHWNGHILWFNDWQAARKRVTNKNATRVHLGEIYFGGKAQFQRAPG